MKKINCFVYALVSFLMVQSADADDLLTVYNKALQADPTLKSAQYRKLLGEAQRGQAGGALLPQINASVNLSLNERTPAEETAFLKKDGYKGQRYNVSLSQSIIDLPKFWDWDRSKEVLKRYELENIDAEQSLMLDVVERYFSALEAWDEHFLIQQDKQSTEKQLQQLKKQFKKQIIKITDVFEVEAKLNNLEADEIESEVIYVIAKESLTELTGERLDTLAKLKDKIDFIAINGNVEQWIERAQNNNPSILATQKGIAAASSDVAQQKSRHLPVVDAQLTYYNTDTGFQSAQTSETQTLVAALNINVPIFSGGVMTRRADEAAQKLQIAKQENIAKQREIVKLTRDSFLSTNASLRRIKAAKKALESSVKSRDAMEKGFKYGVQTISDVLISQAREFRSRKELLQAKYQYFKSKMRFKRVVGDIGEESIQEINAWLLPE